MARSDELAKLAAKYPKVRIERMDVTDPAQIAALGAKLKGVPIDILLNNAGLVRTDPLNKPGGNTNQMFGTLDYKLLDDFIHTNVAGPLMISETFIGNVKASHQKKIIAISSAAGSVSVPPFMPNGSPVPDHYWYRISKAALNSAMRLLSAQFKQQGIIVVMFHPGGVQVESFGNVKLAGFVPPAEAGQTPDPNADMGGNDFGVNNPGSWDDGSGGGGGGWDDGGGGGGDSGGWT